MPEKSFGERQGELHALVAGQPKNLIEVVAEPLAGQARKLALIEARTLLQLLEAPDAPGSRQALE